MIAGLEEPTSGAIVLDGEEITSIPTHKRNLGMCSSRWRCFHT